MPIDVSGEGSVGASGSLVPNSVKSRDTILVQGSGVVVDAATISAIDGIYGIYFEFTLPKTSWKAQIIHVSASDYASYIQAIGAHDHVTAAFYAPDTNAAGLLVDTLVVVVESSSGLSSTQVEIPFSQLNTPAAFGKIDAANVKLNTIEANV
jgi:hypothetical protein